MNFSFSIIRFGEKNRRCQYYTVLIENEQVHEAGKFLQNPLVQNSPDLSRLKTRFEKMKDRYGARQRKKPKDLERVYVNRLCR